MNGRDVLISNPDRHPEPFGRSAPATGHGCSPCLLERERELRTLGEMLRDAEEGVAGAAFIEASAGLGKTALLRTAREEAAAAGFRSFAVAPDEPERHIPFEALRNLLDRLPEDDADEAVLGGPVRPCRSLLAGEEPQPPLDSHTLQHAFVLLLRRLAARAPVLLAVDDAHWADAASLATLATLVRRVKDCRLLVVVAARPEDAPPGRGVLAQIAAEPDTRLLRPHPLSVDAVRALVRRALGDHVTEAFCRACHDVTSGNPFLLRQLVRELDEEAVDIRMLSRDELQRLGPRSISRAVLVRLARLTPDAVAVCRAAAILGDHGSLSSVAALAQLPLEDAAVAADDLVRVAILRRSLGFAFVHPIVRSAVLADLAPHEQAALHADAARILRAGGAAAGALAAHLLEAEPAGDDDAVRTLLDAARDALRRGIPADAVAYLRRALEEPPAEALRGSVLEELGRAELHRDPAAALELLQQAADRHTGGEAALQARRTQAEALIALGRTRDAILLLEAVARDAASAGEQGLASLCEAQIAAVARTERETRDLGREHRVRLAREAGSSALGCVLHLADAAVEEALAGGGAARALELARAALADGHLVQEGDTRLAREVAVVLDWTDCLEEAEEVLRQVLARAVHEADHRGRVAATALLGRIAYRRGDLGTAADKAEEALCAAAAVDWFAAVVHAVATLTDVLLEQASVREGERLLSEHGLQRALPGVRASIGLYASRARLRLEGGDADAARCDADEGIALAAVWGPRGPATSGLREWQVRACVALGETTEARRLAEAELRRAAAWGAPTAHARARRTLAGLCRGEEAIGRLRRAVTLASQGPDALETARAQLDLGAALRRAGRRSVARRHLAQARVLAEDCGATALARDAATELASLGVRRRRAEEDAGRDLLTACERRVAELVAEGLSNREIAEQLYVTLKTVEAHLTSTYRKLGIRSRTELVRRIGSGVAAPGG